MLSFRTAFLATAMAFVVTVQADYKIDPSSVPLSTRSEQPRHSRHMFSNWFGTLILYRQGAGATMKPARVRPSARTSPKQVPR